MLNFLQDNGDPIERLRGDDIKLELLVTLEQMIDNNYPLVDREDDGSGGVVRILPTRDKYRKVTRDSPVFVLDCEMCLTSERRSELTRVSIVCFYFRILIFELWKFVSKILNNFHWLKVLIFIIFGHKIKLANWFLKYIKNYNNFCTKTLLTQSCFYVNINGEVVLDTLVKPFNKITNYLTEHSGITEKMLESCNVRLSEVQHAIRTILPRDAILCGHSIEFDLRALQMSHP